MRNSWRQHGFEHIEIQRDIQRSPQPRNLGDGVAPSVGAQHLDPELGGLRPLVRVERPNTNLDQPYGEMLFHHASERARVGVAIAGWTLTVAVATSKRKLVIQIAVGVEMQYDGRLGAPGKAAEDGVGDGVIAAQDERSATAVDQQSNPFLNRRSCLSGILRELDIPHVLEHARCGKVVATLVIGVTGCGPERLSNGCRGLGGASLPG